MSMDINEAQLSTKPRILIADKSRIMRGALVRILEAEFDLVEADNASAAWTLLADDDSLQVLVTALDPGGLGGLALLARLRSAAQDRLKRLPVVMLADEETGDVARNEVQAAGPSRYLARPFNKEDIGAALGELLAGELRPGAGPDEELAGGAVDTVTGLFNRAYFELAGDKALSLAQRHSMSLSVVLVKVDSFEFKVRQHGRQIADQLLRKLGRYILAAVRNDDSVARIGSDEFGVIAPMTDEPGARIMAERILTKVRQTVFNYGDKQVSFTVSVGLTTPQVHRYRSFKSLADGARRQMELAMREGGNRLAYTQGGATASQPSVPEPLAEPTAYPGVENALKMLAQDQGEQLRGHHRALLIDILPLLEQADQALGLELSATLDTLRDRIDRMC